MAMSQFEKAVINELQGIKKELHELNKKKSAPGQVDGANVQLDGQAISNALSKTLHGATIMPGDGPISKLMERW